jgi:hypothetical protein
VTQERVLLMPVPGGGWLALTPDEFERARSRAMELVPAACVRGRSVVATESPREAPEALLDAGGIEGLTGVSSSWWSGAARRGEIPHYQIGRWVRFRLSEVLSFGPKAGYRKVVGHAHRVSAAAPRRGRKKVPATASLHPGGISDE